MTKIFYTILIFVLMITTAMAEDCVLDKGATAGIVQNGQGVFIQTNREIKVEFVRHMIPSEKQQFAKATKQNWQGGVVASTLKTDTQKDGFVEVVQLFVKQSDVRCK